ncbi:unnamed protein product [Alternaria alternata]
MKRKGVNVSAEAGKRQRTAVKEMREADCVYDRAAPYLLWVNREPEKVLDRDNNKPALWKDLIPALRAKYGDKADETSRVLKQRILNNVRKNANHFTSITLDHYLHEYPGADGDAYGARFGHKVWRDVLSLVTSFAGPTLQHKYIAGIVLESTRKISLPAITQTAQDLICQILEIANNLAL